MKAFLVQNRVKLIFAFAIGYPFCIGYLWYLLHIGKVFEAFTGSYPSDAFSQFLILFLPAVTALFMLPIRPFPYRFASVLAITMTYITFMTWPVMAFRHASYCAIHHLDCLPY
jgi:hypothetical protein